MDEARGFSIALVIGLVLWWIILVHPTTFLVIMGAAVITALIARRG